MLRLKNLFIIAKQAVLLSIKFALIILIFCNNSALAQTTTTLSPTDDAFIRGGTYASTNFGTDPTLMVKSSSSSLTRYSYLKFSISSVASVASATLRIYGSNTTNTSAISISAYQVNTDSWTEGTIVWNNAPAASTLLSSVSVNNTAKYYDFDVTNFVNTQFSGDKTVSFLVKDPANQDIALTFNSKENAQNQPQLVITSNAAGGPSNALLFVENPDKFPPNGHFVFSKIQTPWAGGEPWAHGDSVTFNSNRDSVKIRVRNNGISPLTISNFILANTAMWHIEKLNGSPYNPASTFPLNIASGGAADLILRFIGTPSSPSRVIICRDTLTIVSNDDKFPSKQVFLDGVWQKLGEGSREPHAQEIIKTFDFKTSTGFVSTDPDLGDSTKLKGDEIKPSYFVRANPSYPVVITQMASYHSCCISPERLQWYDKGSSTLKTLFTHLGTDAQRIQPRRVSSDSSLATAVINPTAPFGFKIGSLDWMDAAKNPGSKIGIRVWKAIDTKGNIIPNCYIMSNDYLGTTGTNYDYNDNVHYITNVRPEIGAAFSSILTPTPSDLDFGEKILNTTDSLTLSIKNSGQTYANGSSDPAITISSVQITGENSSEFSATMPAGTLNPQQTSNIKVKFKPVTQGLKIADLLIFYNNSVSPLRVPLYGIGKSSGTTVAVNYRIKCGSSTSVVVNGKTWVKNFAIQAHVV